MVFNTRRTILKIQSLINSLVESIDAESGCLKKGTGKRTTRTKKIGDFNSITVISRCKVNATVNVVVGEQPGIEIEIDDNLHDIIAVDTANGKLTIKSIQNYYARDGLVVNIKTKFLNKITIEGAVNMNVQHVNNETLSAHISGLVKLIIDGNLNAGRVESNGSGVDIDLSRLKTKEVYLVINGAGNARVNATEKLKVLINGTGNVRYSGNPAIVNKKINGVGFVTPEN